MKILVVDDEPEVVSVLIDHLSARGHAVFGITGGADVTSWVQKHNCDLLLLDVSLPDVNGLNKISEVLSRSPKTKVIVMSGLHKGTWAETALRTPLLPFGLIQYPDHNEGGDYILADFFPGYRFQSRKR